MPLSPPPSVPDTFASFGPDTGGTSASITEQALSRPFLTVGSLAGIVALCGLSCLACLLRSRSTPRRKQPDSQRRKSSLKLRDGQEGAVPLAPTPSTRHPSVATSFLKFTRSLTIRKPAAIVSRSTDGDLADLINGEIVLDAKARAEVETLEAETLGLRAQVALRQLGVRDLKSLLHSHDSRGMHGLPRDQLMAASQSLVLRSPEAASAAIAAANKREVGPATTTAAAPADPPLPAGWDTVVTEDGEEYFHFPSTGETTWERPTVDAAAATVGGAVPAYSSLSGVSAHSSVSGEI